MTTLTTVTFTKTKASPWLEAEIHERVERLTAVCADLRSCRVVVDIPHRSHRRGNRFSLRIELAVPGEDLAITHDANLHGVVKDLDEQAWAKRFDVEANRRDIRVVMSDAFDVAKRRLRDYLQVRRRAVKRHDRPAQRLPVAAPASGRHAVPRPARARAVGTT